MAPKIVRRLIYVILISYGSQTKSPVGSHRHKFLPRRIRALTENHARRTNSKLSELEMFERGEPISPLAIIHEDWPTSRSIVCRYRGLLLGKLTFSSCYQCWNFKKSVSEAMTFEQVFHRKWKHFLIINKIFQRTLQKSAKYPFKRHQRHARKSSSTYYTCITDVTNFSTATIFNGS